MAQETPADDAAAQKKAKIAKMRRKMALAMVAVVVVMVIVFSVI
jgi:hypothetical protein